MFGEPQHIYKFLRTCLICLQCLGLNEIDAAEEPLKRAPLLAEKDKLSKVNI